MNSIEEKVSFLKQYSQETGISLEKLLCLFLVLKDNLFFTLDMLAGESCRFPPLPTVRKHNKTYEVLPLNKTRYQTRSGWVPVKDLKVGDEIDYNGVDYEVIEAPFEIFTYTFIVANKS